MKTSFSTLGCPDWTLTKCFDEASRMGFNGVELRFIESSDALWDVPGLRPAELAATRRVLKDRGLEISNVGARAHFHFTSADKRKEQIEEAKRNFDIAAGLDCRGVRIWGDKIQQGGDRKSTMSWISESLWALAEYGRPMKVNARLESHGDFTRSTDMTEMLRGCGCHGVAANWDPANAIVGCDEDPVTGAVNLGPYLEHVHIKDEKVLGGGKRDITLMGEGDIPLGKVLEGLRKVRYASYVSLEWEKRNFPNAAPPEVAFPQFIKWWKAHS